MFHLFSIKSNKKAKWSGCSSLVIYVFQNQVSSERSLKMRTTSRWWWMVHSWMALAVFSCRPSEDSKDCIENAVQYNFFLQLRHSSKYFLFPHHASKCIIYVDYGTAGCLTLLSKFSLAYGTRHHWKGNKVRPNYCKWPYRPTLDRK